jgi:dihydrofolate synthase/folylpolyglutamate synthase
MLAWLAARQNHERTPPSGPQSAAYGLGRTRTLLEMVGSPHEKLRVVHVAGTKGKGSTVAMISAILGESGLRVGRYMSPHVHSIEERICIDGRPIGPRELDAAFRIVAPAVDRLDARARDRGGRGPTWFEAVTAIAMLAFARGEVDIAVLETGLGGRLDATNVSHPLVSVITSISLDHMRQLGRTVTAIAGEKAGIIKRGCPVVSGATSPHAARVIAATAARRHARLFRLGHDFLARYAPAAASGGLLEPGSFEFEAMASELENPRGPGAIERYRIGMRGSHQAVNAALAVAAVRLLSRHRISVGDAAIRRGLASVTLPARVELVDGRPPIVIDAAHNVASMESLVETIRPAVAVRPASVLVFAASTDKQIARMLAKATGVFRHLVLTRYRTNPRAATLEKLAAAAKRAGFHAPRIAEGPNEAMALARKLAGPRGLICVAGSFFLASEVREAT